MIFDELWGEYKCKILEHRIYDPNDLEECDSWKRRQTTKKEKKGT